MATIINFRRETFKGFEIVVDPSDLSAIIYPQGSRWAIWGTLPQSSPAKAIAAAKAWIKQAAPSCSRCLCPTQLTGLGRFAADDQELAAALAANPGENKGGYYAKLDASLSCKLCLTCQANFKGLQPRLLGEGMSSYTKPALLKWARYGIKPEDCKASA